MLKFKCHKVVEAAKIVEIRRKGIEPLLDRNMLEFGRPSLEFEAVTDQWLEHHAPTIGGYFIRYEDGYTSFSPAEAFEKGYTEIDAQVAI